MKPGSVIVDLAVERGGNVEGAEAGKVVTVAKGVKIVGHLNMPGRIAASASLLYAKNLYTFLESLFDKEAKAIRLDMEDQIVKATALTHDGKVVHPNFQTAATATPETAEAGAGSAEVADAAKGTEPGLDVAPKARPKRAAAATRKSASGNGSRKKKASPDSSASTSEKGES
jgi:NAD(P) transhydrogenase subunit alpha